MSFDPVSYAMGQKTGGGGGTSFSSNTFTSDGYTVDWIRLGYVCMIRVYRNETSSDTTKTLSTKLPENVIPAQFVAVPAYAISGGYLQIANEDGKITVRHSGNSWYSASATYIAKDATPITSN